MSGDTSLATAAPIGQLDLAALKAVAIAATRDAAAKVVEAQAAFLHRAPCNAAARTGKYTESMEHQLVA